MNKRIVLISMKEPGYVRLMGIQDLSKITITVEYLISFLESGKEREVKKILDLGEGDGAMLFGPAAFEILSRYYHYAIRRENFHDCLKLDRLSISGGAYVKCVNEVPSTEVILNFLSPSFTADIDFSWFKHKTIKTYQETCNFLTWIENLPPTERLGFDYETSGMALDPVFYVSGLSICSVRFGGFISFSDLRRTASDSEMTEIMTRLAKVLEARQSYLFVFNSLFEFQVSHRIFGVDLYNLCDAQVVNVLNGDHLMKKYSLKWTAQRVLSSKVYDTDFDYLNKLLDEMYFTVIVGKKKSETKKVMKVTPGNYRLTPEWAAICQRYPDYIQEFELLISEYWGMPFMNIPSDILGYYCNLDSFYTLMIYETMKDTYSEDAWQTFFDNARLAVRLHASGLYIDEPFRLKYKKESIKMMAWGITYCSCVWTWIKQNSLEKSGKILKKLSPIVRKLIDSGKFFGGELGNVAKYILSSHIDDLDAYDLGINEGSLLMEYGPDFAGEFMEALRECMTEAGMIKVMKKTGLEKITKLDAGVVRKKKLITLVAQRLYVLLGIDKFDSLKIDGKKIAQVEEYVTTGKLYSELQGIFKNQMPDVTKVPDKFTFFGTEYGAEEYADLLSSTIFKCTSPPENDAIITKLYEMFQPETCFLGALLKSTQQLDGGDKFYSSRGITSISEAFTEFMGAWQEYDTAMKAGETIKLPYPDKVFDWAYSIWGWKKKSKTVDSPFKVLPEGVVIKEVWTKFEGLYCQTSMFPQFKAEFESYGTPWSVSDMDDRFYMMRKILINYMLFKKYAKVLSTYVDGMFNNKKLVIEGPGNIPIREALPGEPGAVEKCFVKYEVNTKSSKRWSSGFHTIPSHSDLKDIICCPPSWDSSGNIIYGGAPMLLTYFDISSAEVKAAGFASMDPDLIAKFRSGEDIYIYSAILYLGKEAWDKLEKGERKKWRKRFKTIFLGVLYGLGKNSLAERLDCTVAEAEHIIQGLYTSFPQLRLYVESQQQYPLDHDGYVNTMLGDKLRIAEFTLYKKAKNPREINNLVARIKRLGVNLPIQGGTSSIMARGFMNNIRMSKLLGMKYTLQPIIVVHDSNTNYFGIKDLFHIRPFYDLNYTEYCESFGPRIKLLFDLLVGPSYECAAPMTMINENTIEFTGNAYGLGKLYDKIMSCTEIKVECDTTRESLVPEFIEHPIDRFIREGGTSVIKDVSSYTIRFRKLD